jgi:MoaA/NifB/PqqE/SkfB family radical SAM enzyme
MNDFTKIPLGKIVESHDISLHYNQIFKIHWVMSYFCNYNCSYCWPDSRHKIPDKRDEQQFTDAVDRLMGEINKRGFKNYQLTLSGGEPTAHPHIIPVLKQFAKYKNDDGIFHLTIVSNLSRSYKWMDEFVEAVDKMNNVTFVASYHHEFAKLEEFAAKAKYLTEKGVSVQINITFAVDLFEEYHQSALYLKEQGLIVKALPHRSTNTRDYTPEELAIMQHGFTFDGIKYPPQRNPNPPTYVTNRSVCGSSYSMELIDDEGNKYYIDYPERFPSLGYTNFKDWICHSGYQAICIDEDGTTKRGRAGCWNEYIGNIFDPTTQILHETPQPCSRTYCSAATDSVTHKVKPSGVSSGNKLRIAIKPV